MERTMPRPTAVLFDMDGVLVHSIVAWFRLVCLTAQHFCKPDITREQFDAGWGQGIAADLETFFVGCKAREIEDFYAAHLLDFTEHITVTEDALSTLQALHGLDLPCAVITNTPTGLARDILAWAGLIGNVDLTVGAQEGLLSKPAPDPILHACKVLRRLPENAWMIGDSRFDLQAAEAAGCRFLGYNMSYETSLTNLSEVVSLLEDESTK